MSSKCCKTNECKILRQYWSKCRRSVVLVDWFVSYSSDVNKIIVGNGHLPVSVAAHDPVKSRAAQCAVQKDAENV